MKDTPLLAHKGKLWGVVRECKSDQSSSHQFLGMVIKVSWGDSMKLIKTTNHYVNWWLTILSLGWVKYFRIPECVSHSGILKYLTHINSERYGCCHPPLLPIYNYVYNSVGNLVMWMTKPTYVDLCINSERYCFQIHYYYLCWLTIRSLI